MTALKNPGSRRSCAIENRMRACPNSSTKITVVSPASAANFTRTHSQPMPVASIATTPDRRPSFGVWHHAGHHQGHESIQIVQMINEPRMPDRHVALRRPCLSGPVKSGPATAPRPGGRAQGANGHQVIVPK